MKWIRHFGISTIKTIHGRLDATKLKPPLNFVVIENKRTVIMVVAPWFAIVFHFISAVSSWHYRIEGRETFDSHFI